MRQWGKEGAGQETENDEPQDARPAPNCAAATPEQMNHRVTGYILSSDLFTSVTPHCHTHYWLH